MKTAANHLIKLSRSGSLQMLEEAQDKWDRIRKAREDYQFDEGKKKGRVEGRKEGLATGLQKGLATGLKKGRVEGLATGLQKGRVEGIATGLQKGIHQVALNLLKEGADLAFVAKTTKLPKSEVKKLKAKI